MNFFAAFQFVDGQLLPKSECLKDTVERVLPFWYDQIVPSILVSYCIWVPTVICIYFII